MTKIKSNTTTASSHAERLRLSDDTHASHVFSGRTNMTSVKDMSKVAQSITKNMKKVTKSSETISDNLDKLAKTIEQHDGEIAKAW